LRVITACAAALAASAVVVTTGLPALATAGTAPASALTRTVHDHPTLSATARDRVARATITCTLRFIGANGGVPHHSGHVPGTINVRAGVTCTAPVTKIAGKVGLFGDSGSKINPFGSTGSATAKGNAALVCTPGYYVGAANATITFPPGYSPPTGTVTNQTAEVHITKC
jgi:hypothetical protein